MTAVKGKSAGTIVSWVGMGAVAILGTLEGCVFREAVRSMSARAGPISAPPDYLDRDRLISTTSPTILNAISAAVSAPISNPTGPRIRPMSSSENPSPRSLSRRAAWVFAGQRGPQGFFGKRTRRKQQGGAQKKSPKANGTHAT